MRVRPVFRTVVALAVGLVLGTAAPGLAATSGSPHGSRDVTQLRMLESFWRTDTAAPSHGARPQVLAHATPDECFAGVGKPYPAPVVKPDGTISCPQGSQPKVNEAYVWGLTKVGSSLWFGTAPNVHCLVLASYLRTTTANVTDSWVCEGKDSYYLKLFQQQTGITLPAALGDWRPPHLYVDDQRARTLTRLDARLDKAGQARLSATVGIRSAGSINGIILFAGPALSGGLNVFVFRSDGSYVGSENVPVYTNIRKWISTGGALYTGVGTAGGGEILRFTGSSVTDPFQFERVGQMSSEPAELAVHKGRLYTATWPRTGKGVEGAGSLWMSPVLGSQGLHATDLGAWRKVWSATQYEPDVVTAMTYGGGALASYGGTLYWGTMHVPMTAALAHTDVYGPSTSTEATLANVLGSWRAISIFRGDGFDTATPKVELLYGERVLPVYGAPGSAHPGWTLQPNAMHATPRYGPSGFGNPFNNYTWTMAVAGDHLYVGTMDWSYLLAKGVQPLLGALGLPSWIRIPIPAQQYGADLWSFVRPGRPAVRVSGDGLGNYANYGIRTMIADGNTLYLGTANPMNLMAGPGRPRGGWELLKLDASRS